MNWLPKKTAWWIGSTIFAGAVAVAIWMGVGRRGPEDRVYRIGWDPDPPFQAAGPDGGATGLAIELVREAAKRRGIRLEWVRQSGGADAALGEHKVDLWPLLTLTPNRRGRVNITDPYLETEHCFIVRAESGFTEVRDLAGALVSFHDLRINHINLNLAQPRARLLPVSGTDAAIENVCRGRADAAFVDEYTAISAMLGGLTCKGHELLLIATPEIQARMGVGSTFGASAAAEAIRDEIGRIAGEDRLFPTLLHWSYFSRRHLEALQALREANRREQLLAGLSAILFGALLIVGWLTHRTLRERRRAKTAEKDLDATLRRYQVLTEQAADGVFLVDRNGRFLLANAHLCEMLGYTNQELLQLTAFDTCRLEDHEAARRRLEDTAVGESIRFERQARRKDGTVIPIEASVVKLWDGNLQGIIRDVAERKRAEEALRDSEERFRRVFEEGPLGLALVGKDYRFEKANSALCQMVGYDETELIRMSFVDITHPDDVLVDLELAQRLFKREVPFYRIQKRYVKKTGEIIWINLSASVILGSDGEPLHGLAMVEDITEMKRTHEEAIVRQKLESVGSLAGGIAHDFNNLLGAVQAQAELAVTQLDMGESCKEELRAIGEVAMRGSEIVRQLMIYAGKENSVVGPVDLSKTVDEMLSLLRVSVTKRAVIQTDLDQSLPPITASAAQIRQVVMNLITNASDAIGQRDGQIRVNTRRVTLNAGSGGISSGTLPDGDYAQLEVSDTGCGMSAQTQTQVFDPFFSTKSAGRGLGLAVVQGIVRSLGGAIHLRSQPGEGTTFRVVLPCAKAMAAVSDAVSGDVEAPVSSRRGTVLVVEDEGTLRRAVVMMLRRAGFDVFEAADGKAAIEFLNTDGRKIDVMLLDMTLPGASSHQIVAAAASAKATIRVILTSAYSQEMASGAMTAAPQIRSFIRKPFQVVELVKSIQNSMP
jgi:PAS domain S-box-containing protein